MHSTRRLQEIARDSSLLMTKADYSAEKSRQGISMGPPPPVSVPRALQPSVLHKNSNLHRPFKEPKEFPHLPHGHDNLAKKLKTSRNEGKLDSKVSYNGRKTPRAGRAQTKEVSLASILKRSRPYYESATDSARVSARNGNGRGERGEFVPRYKRRKVTIVNPLFEEYKECIDASHDTLQNEGRSALNSAYEDLSTSIKDLAIRKEEQLSTIENQLSSVLTPFNEITLPNGKFVNISIELQTFRSLLETEEKFLREKWADWEKLQEDIATLAVQVLGDDATDLVPEDLYKRVPEGGYKKDSEKWMKELEEELNGPMEEMNAAGEEALKKMISAEKESERKFNEQKSRIIAMITTEDD